MLKIILCFLFLLTCVSCGQSEFCNIYSFTYNYNHFTKESISIGDFCFNSSDKTSYTAILGQENQEVLLTLKSGANNIIEEVDVSLAKTASNPLQHEHIETFRKILVTSLSAYCSYTEADAADVLSAFNLSDDTVFSQEGELTLKRGNFYFIYYSTKLISRVMIYNTYIKKIQPTEKPVSKPYYAEGFIIKETP